MGTYVLDPWSVAYREKNLNRWRSPSRLQVTRFILRRSKGTGRETRKPSGLMKLFSRSLTILTRVISRTSFSSATVTVEWLLQVWPIEFPIESAVSSTGTPLSPTMANV